MRWRHVPVTSHSWQLHGMALADRMFLWGESDPHNTVALICGTIWHHMIINTTPQDNRHKRWLQSPVVMSVEILQCMCPSWWWTEPLFCHRSIEEFPFHPGSVSQQGLNNAGFNTCSHHSHRRPRCACQGRVSEGGAPPPLSAAQIRTAVTNSWTR